LNDLASLRVKEEIIAFDEYVSSVQGVHKLHFEILMSQYGQTLEKLDEQRRLEKEYAHEIASLKYSLEGKEEVRATLEEKLDSIEETNNEVISKLIKERDHARAKIKVLKKEKIEFGVGHDKLVKDLEDLDKTHKALKSEHSFLTKSHEQLQIQLTKNDVPSSSTSSCEHANIIGENARLKDELA
jgi:chromosome segregation ATPase